MVSNCGKHYRSRPGEERGGAAVRKGLMTGAVTSVLGSGQSASSNEHPSSLSSSPLSSACASHCLNISRNQKKPLTQSTQVSVLGDEYMRRQKTDTRKNICLEFQGEN